MTMNSDQALAKLAAGTSATNMPPKTAPKGQPNVAPAPGKSGNATSASGNPKVAPGPTAHSNATSASGNPTVDTAPQGGEKGKANTGTLAMTKAAQDAGFAVGMLKAAHMASEEAEIDSALKELDDAGVNIDVLSAIEVLADNGYEVHLKHEGGAEKTAAVKGFWEDKKKGRFGIDKSEYDDKKDAWVKKKNDKSDGKSC